MEMVSTHHLESAGGSEECRHACVDATASGPHYVSTHPTNPPPPPPPLQHPNTQRPKKKVKRKCIMDDMPSPPPHTNSQ
jgi:hypothetical protein